MAESRDKETLVAYYDLTIPEVRSGTTRHGREEGRKFEIREETKG